MKHGRFSSICASVLTTAALGTASVAVVPSAMAAGKQAGGPKAPSQTAQILKQQGGPSEAWGWDVLDGNGNVVASQGGYRCKGDAVHGLQTYGWTGNWSVTG